MLNNLGDKVYKKSEGELYNMIRMEYKTCNFIRMEDAMYGTELLHHAITKWHDVRLKIREIVSMPHEVYIRPPVTQDEDKEKELDLLCKDFKQLNEETLKYVNHQVIKMVETYSEINCLRHELVDTIVHKFNKTLQIN